MEKFNLFNRIQITAKTNSGKTFLTRYLLDQYKHDFDKVILVCPTEKINGFYKGLVNDKDVYETIDENWIKQLMNFIAIL